MATGNLVLPSIADVRAGVQYGANGTEYTGTCAVPSADDVRSGTSVDATTGNMTLPAVADVQSAVQFGTSGTEYTGTFTEPGVGNVESGVQYGAAGTEFTGNMTLPAVGDVQETVQYGTSGTEYTGTFGVPAEGEVSDGVGYGEDDTEFTGTAVLEGTGPAPTFAGIVQLEAVGGGCLRATWAAGTGTIGTYNIYVRADSSTNLFTATYLKIKTDSSTIECIFRMAEDNTTFLNDTSTYYVGIRAENNGQEDANTEVLSIKPSGSGATYLKLSDIVAIGR